MLNLFSVTSSDFRVCENSVCFILKCLICVGQIKCNVCPVSSVKWFLSSRVFEIFSNISPSRPLVDQLSRFDVRNIQIILKVSFISVLTNFSRPTKTLFYDNKSLSFEICFHKVNEFCCPTPSLTEFNQSFIIFNCRFVS